MTIKATLANDNSRMLLLSLGTIIVTDVDQGYAKQFATPVTVVNCDNNVIIEVGFSHEGKLYLFDNMLSTVENTMGACEALIASGKYGKIKLLAVNTKLNIPVAPDQLVHCVSMKTEDYSIFANVPDLNKISEVLIRDLGIPSPP